MCSKHVPGLFCRSNVVFKIINSKKVFEKGNDYGNDAKTK